MLRYYGYFRSSAAYRVRIAFALKGLEPELVTRHLRKGEQHDPAYLARNPQGLIPALELEDGTIIPQSLAIIEYLDEVYPAPALLPADPKGRARVRALAQVVACDIHPVDNLRVLNYLKQPLGHSQAEVETWYNHWIAEGFAALETLLANSPDTGRFCHGDTPGLADICLVPQVANSFRHALDLTPYPTIRRIYEACMALPAFDRARPENQPDFEG